MRLPLSYVFWAFVVCTVALLVALAIGDGSDPRGTTVIDVLKGAELILVGAVVGSSTPTVTGPPSQ